MALAIGMLIASRLGSAAGLRWHPRSSDAGRNHFSWVQSALLGLLALLLGFTMSMVDQRFEARRQLMLDDAVDLGSLNLRASLLPEPGGEEFRKLLREYVEQQATASHSRYQPGSDAFLAEAARAEDVHRRMTAIVRAALQSGHPAQGIEPLIGQLGDTLAVHRRWVNALETQVPPTIFALICGAAFVAAGIVGFSGGLGGHRAMLESVLLACFVSAIFFVIHDLDTPAAGLARSDRSPLVHLSELLKLEAQQHP